MNQPQFVIEKEDFQQLLDVLRADGRRVIAPTIRSEAIIYDEIASVADLPVGWTDEQNGGEYHLKHRSDDALFGYSVGPQSWKRFLHPPEARLWQAERTEQGFAIVHEEAEPSAYAFIGVRPCELHAIAIQDRVFLQGAFVDPIYQHNREDLFVVALNCTQPGGTCFCASLGTGPRVDEGFDLALTEIIQAEQHYFLVEVGTEAGAAMLDRISHREATFDEIQTAQDLLVEAEQHMGRTLDTANLKQKLYESYEHPRWEEVAGRCLMCGNCTMVCPTCFCATIEDSIDLTGEHAERRRVWDSCFTMDFSYIHGGSVRYSPKARYRQWLTHKMATWIDEFGMRGCVGCGRCITWCPVGIDITAEARAIQESQPVKVQQEDE
jgi:ferredoxin